MKEKTYNTIVLSEMLNISTTAVCELKKKMGIKQANEKDLRMLRYMVDCIRNSQKVVTTSTINMYYLEKEREKEYANKRRYYGV